MRGLYLLLVCGLLGRTFTPITCKPTLFFTWSVLRLSIKNIQIMRKILFLFIVVVFFYGCSKDNEDKSMMLIKLSLLMERNILKLSILGTILFIVKIIKQEPGVISFLLVIDYLSQSKIMKLVFTRFALRLI